MRSSNEQDELTGWEGVVDQVKYWLKGESTQNYGDYLTEFLLERLFYDRPLYDGVLRIIGSCIDDGLLAEGKTPEGARVKTVFWGCGLRHEASFGEHNRQHAIFLAVRGPLTRSALRLGAMTPIGDPALLLPAIYSPNKISALAETTILVPHFHDTRSDVELKKLSGCDVIVRPNVSNNFDCITDFIDAIASAKFVLCGAMHAAITVCAYGGRFAFWDSGDIDLPFKWQDFAASVEIPCSFAQTVQQGMQIYEHDIRPNLRMPNMVALAAVAPFPIRNEVMAAIVSLDLERNGCDDRKVNVPALRYRKHDARGIMMKNMVLPLREELARKEQYIAELQQAVLEKGRHVSQLTDELSAKEQGVAELQRQLACAMAMRNQSEASLQAILQSTSWRVLEPARRVGARLPATSRFIRRSLKMAWWTVTLQLPSRLSAWRHHKAALLETRGTPDHAQARPIEVVDERGGPAW